MVLPTKLRPNEFIRPILKTQCPRRGALGLGGAVHGPAAHLQRLGTVTPYASRDRPHSLGHTAVTPTLTFIVKVG